jgi:hypothetical protein
VPAKLTFDPACIKKVPIEAVTPNSWNPKEKDTEEYHKVKRSLELHGLRGAILVREARAGSGFDYEIIDGEQRFTAATELGFKELYVYNLGTVVDKEAKAMTIWWEVQVPFDTPQLSKLVVELDDTRTELPFSGAQLRGLKEMAGIKLPKEEKLNAKTSTAEDPDYRVFTCRMRKEQHEILVEAIEAIRELEAVDHATCLTTLAEEYLARE